MSLIKSDVQTELEQAEVASGSPKIFYGWWIVITCVVMLTFSSGIGYYGLGVFLPSLEKEFKVSPTLISIGTTIFFLVGGAIGPYVGRRIDLFGPRLVTIAGNIFFGIGLVGLALSQELWHTYVAYAVMAVGFACMGLITVSALVSNWFRARRGLAMGLAMSGLSLGGVIIVPVTTNLIIAFGWRTTGIILAILLWLIAIPMAALLIKRRPADMGLQPDGVPAPVVAPSSSNSPPVPAEVEWTLAAARRTSTFWAIAIGYLLVYLAQTGVIIHQLRFLTYGTEADGALSPQTASFAISITALASIGGRVSLGSVIDRLDRRWVAVAVMLIQASATTCLLFARGNLLMVYVAVLLFGLGTGCVVMLHALLVSDRFGISSFGSIYGATMVVTMFGTAGGPWFASFLFDIFGSYNVAFLLFAGLDVLAAIAVAFARPPKLQF